ncbi:hypothetical protein B0H14DRAFT_2586785 [Mycena olivaceomarginata]|nr:hypothetical protein B0H14DRAFT_2586785 [Mycena olivaceomarginata]
MASIWNQSCTQTHMLSNSIQPKPDQNTSNKAQYGPQGKNITVLTYVTLPKKKFDPTAAVLLLTDVLGLPSLDNLLLADEWAAVGFQASHFSQSIWSQSSY